MGKAIWEALEGGKGRKKYNKKKTFGKKKMTLFLNLNIIPLCKQDTFCSYIHDLMEI